MNAETINKAIAAGKVVTAPNYGVITMFEVTAHTVKVCTGAGSFHRFRIGALDWFCRRVSIN